MSLFRGVARGCDNGRLACAAIELDLPAEQPIEGAPHYLPNPVRLTIQPAEPGEEVDSTISLSGRNAARLALALLIAAFRSVGYDRRMRELRRADIEKSDRLKAEVRRRSLAAKA